MLSDFAVAQLGELVENLDRLRVPVTRRDRIPGPYPYYGAAGIQDWVDDYIFEGPHLLVAEDGSVEGPDGGLVLQMVGGRFWANNHAHVLRASSETETRFIYYALQTVTARPFMTGAVQQKISQRNLNRIEIPYPRECVRRGIVKVLGTLDDKIELNRKMNRTLEEMAQALFKSWFVDFDGVPESELVESELGPIPRGWAVGPLGEGFDLTMGLSPPGHTYNEDGEGLPFFQGARDFGDRFPTNRVFCTDPRRLANVHDTLVSVRAPVGRPNIAWTNCCIGRGVAALRHNSGSRSYTFAVAKDLEQQFERFNAEGTVFGSIGKKDFLQLRLVVPPDERIREFDAIVSPLDDRIRVAAQESRTLAQLRDTLLPKLISGEIRVPEAEQAVEAAL
jgi:type I restriction enzyme S subunit